MEASWHNIMSAKQDLENSKELMVAEDGDDNEEKHGCWARINHNRLVSKLFYLFYFSAFGSLWPYLSLYFKQLFISPRQLGIIVAVRAGIQFFFTPIWGVLADKFNKSKCVLLLGLVAWLISTISLAIVPNGEEPKVCFKTNSLSLFQTNSKEWNFTTSAGVSNTNAKSQRISSQKSPRSRHKAAFGYSVYYPWSLSFFSAPLEPKQTTQLVEHVQSFPDIKLFPDPDKLSDRSRLFILMLCIVIVGVIFASPTQCLADTATLQILGEDSHEYGKQALWGSVGYGLIAFVVGASVSGNKTLNPCSHDMDINYIPCFYAFGIFMILSIVVATRFNFHPAELSESTQSILGGLKVMKDFDYAFFMFVVFFCGIAYGFIQTFLFWHLRELGGEQMLFSFIIITNSSAEVVVYLSSDRFISNIGHRRMIYLGLLCYALRFFYYAYCSRPWLFLPIELIQGITTAAVWSAFVSYVGAEPGVATTLQGLVNGLYNGLGYATGGLLGGVMVHEYGTSTAFLVFGEVSLIILFSFIIVSNIRRTHPRDYHIKTVSQADNFESVVTTDE